MQYSGVFARTSDIMRKTRALEWSRLKIKRFYYIQKAIIWQLKNEIWQKMEIDPER